MDRRLLPVAVAALLVAIAVAAVVSQFASDQPDGLERVSIDQGFDATASEGTDTPLADYSVEGVEDEGLSTALAGIIGVLATLGLTVLVLKVVQGRRSGPEPPS
jgi:cobalt/nickel transport system permease protein